MGHMEEVGEDEDSAIVYYLLIMVSTAKKAKQLLYVSLNPTELLPQREMANNQSVRRHLDAFTRGRIIGKLEEGCSVTSVAAEFELLTASFHDFGDNFKLQEQLPGVQ
ncbi:hypothetical protein TNCV_1915401 [Trichonephila clavipes]|uniref:Uncharacterized protein n=1 Tax=Trichonephila clavipes TaxID=2585209 RepID=A0A8X6W079_TRICX|nr:hypothetical protein TNCV_1915401 [Trichonephila clavipes]